MVNGSHNAVGKVRLRSVSVFHCGRVRWPASNGLYGNTHLLTNGDQLPLGEVKAGAGVEVAAFV